MPFTEGVKYNNKKTERQETTPLQITVKYTRKTMPLIWIWFSMKRYKGWKKKGQWTQIAKHKLKQKSPPSLINKIKVYTYIKKVKQAFYFVTLLYFFLVIYR